MLTFKKTFSQWVNTLYEVLTNTLKMSTIRNVKILLENV